jgi:hypothetical protein
MFIARTALEKVESCLLKHYSSKVNYAHLIPQKKDRWHPCNLSSSSRHLGIVQARLTHSQLIGYYATVGTD